MRVVEIFTSIQGEGANCGLLVTFVRLAGCNLACSYCDTDFHTGTDYSLEALTERLVRERGEGGPRRIIWTGGEPTLQLTEEIVRHFSDLGYWQAIETNGTRTPPRGLDYITVSPKVSVGTLLKNFRNIAIGEIRYPVGAETIVPNIEELPPADHYILSPIFLPAEEDRGTDRNLISRTNLSHCLCLMRQDPRWRLSVQLHKLLQLP